MKAATPGTPSSALPQSRLRAPGWSGSRWPAGPGGAPASQVRSDRPQSPTKGSAVSFSAQRRQSAPAPDVRTLQAATPDVQVRTGIPAQRKRQSLPTSPVVKAGRKAANTSQRSPRVSNASQPEPTSVSARRVQPGDVEVREETRSSREENALPTSPFRGYRERRRQGQLAKESWLAWQQEHGETLVQLQRAAGPRSSSTCHQDGENSQQNAEHAEQQPAQARPNSEGPADPERPPEIPASDADRGSKAGTQPNVQQLAGQTRQQPRPAHTLQRCDGKIPQTAQTGTQALRSEPAKTSQESIVRRGQKPIIRHFSYPPAPERVPQAKKVQLFNMAAGDMPTDTEMTKSLPCILSPSSHVRQNFQGVADSLQEAAAALQRLSQNCQVSSPDEASTQGHGPVEHAPEPVANHGRPHGSPRTLQEHNACLQSQLAEANRRIEELEEERQRFLHEGVYDLVNAMCTSPRRRNFQDGSMRGFEEPGATGTRHPASPDASQLVVDVLLQLVSQEHQHLNRGQHHGQASISDQAQRVL
ncbi:unnamed protein product [Symbiodinium natans]|uniref:Uncharacterized protein n=1 Tax=Symbiodinium natans TaxID=878477 RepID=A0A812NNC5_9DINO|nr:unnamed protein product [Symbiodinium natans]